MGKTSLVLLSVLGGAFLAGCGGTGSTLLGENSDVIATINGSGVNVVNMTISPNEGEADHPDACTATDEGFGCQVSQNADTEQILFTTNSDASDTPYHLYLENNSIAPVDVTLRVQMDGEDEVNQTVTVPVGGATLYVRIFRNNALIVQS